MQPARQDLPVIPGATYRDTLRIMQPLWIYRDIQSIAGSPAVFTVPEHDLASDWPVWVRGVQGMPDANREPGRQSPHRAKLLNADTLEMNSLSAAGLKPMSGQLIYRAPVDLSGATAAMTIWAAGLELFVLSPGAGLAFTTAGTITRELTPEQTAMLVGEGVRYTFDVIYPGEIVTRYFQGAFPCMGT